MQQTQEEPPSLQTRLCCCVINVLPLLNSSPQLFLPWSLLAMQDFRFLASIESLRTGGNADPDSVGPVILSFEQAPG